MLSERLKKIVKYWEPLELEDEIDHVRVSLSIRQTRGTSARLSRRARCRPWARCPASIHIINFPADAATGSKKERAEDPKDPRQDRLQLARLLCRFPRLPGVQLESNSHWHHLTGARSHIPLKKSIERKPGACFRHGHPLGNRRWHDFIWPYCGQAGSKRPVRIRIIHRPDRGWRNRLFI